MLKLGLVKHFGLISVLLLFDFIFCQKSHSQGVGVRLKEVENKALGFIIPAPKGYEGVIDLTPGIRAQICFVPEGTSFDFFEIPDTTAIVKKGYMGVYIDGKPKNADLYQIMLDYHTAASKRYSKNELKTTQHKMTLGNLTVTEIYAPQEPTIEAYLDGKNNVYYVFSSLRNKEIVWKTLEAIKETEPDFNALKEDIEQKRMGRAFSLTIQISNAKVVEELSKLGLKPQTPYIEGNLFHGPYGETYEVPKGYQIDWVSYDPTFYSIFIFPQGLSKEQLKEQLKEEEKISKDQLCISIGPRDKNNIDSIKVFLDQFKKENQGDGSYQLTNEYGMEGLWIHDATGESQLYLLSENLLFHFITTDKGDLFQKVISSLKLPITQK